MKRIIKILLLQMLCLLFCSGCVNDGVGGLVYSLAKPNCNRSSTMEELRECERVVAERPNYNEYKKERDEIIKSKIKTKTKIDKAEVIVPFVWEPYSPDGKVTYDKAAILIKTSESDKYLQLDTGSSKSYLYGANKQEKINFLDEGGRILSHLFQPKKDKEKDNIVGTLGSDYFSGKCLELDFSAEVLVISKCVSVYADSKIEWLKSYVHRSGRPMIEVAVGGKTYANVMFDTGSSIFPLVLTKENWLKVVSKEDAQNPPYKMSVSSWGRIIDLKGAMPESPICVASQCIHKPVYISPSRYGLKKNGIDGVTGNILFYDTHKVIIDFKKNKIGIKPNNSPEH